MGIKNFVFGSVQALCVLFVLTVLPQGSSGSRWGLKQTRSAVTHRRPSYGPWGHAPIRSSPRGPMCAAVIPAPLTRPFFRLTSAYSNWLLRNPVVSNFISGTVIVAIGDAISQLIEGHSDGSARTFADLDRKRIVNAGIAGVVFNGVLLPSWYVLLHKVWPVESSRTIAYKIACNCFAWGFVGNGAIMLMRRMLDGASYDDAMFHVKKDLPGVMVNDYKIWPLYDVMCFSVIPRHTQAIFTGVLGCAWAAYLSYVTHGPLEVGTASVAM